MIPYLKLFYYYIHQSYTISIFIPVLVFFLAFLFLQTTADQYLSTVISSISKRLRLPPSIAALSLIAFANGAPDIFNSILLSDNKEGVEMAIGSLLGAFIFTSTLVVSNVLINSENSIQMKPFQILKDVLTYALALSILTIFGVMKKASFVLVLAFGLIYVGYLVISVWRKEKFQEDEFQNLADQPYPVVNVIIESDDEKDEEKDAKIEEKRNLDENLLQPPREEQYTKLSKSELFSYFVWDTDKNVILRVILIPINIILLSTVPHYYFVTNSYSSSIKQKAIKHFSYFCSTYMVLEVIFHVTYSIWIALGLSLLIIIIDILGQLRHFEIGMNQIMCLLGSVAWIQLSSGCIIDSIMFCSFLFNTNKVFLSMIIISSGNSIGDFFGNGALAKVGNEVMALMGCFSGQLFNLLIGLFLNFLWGNRKDFNLFGSPGSRNLNQKFAILLFVSAFLIIGVHLANLFISHFSVSRKFLVVLICFYLLFITSSVLILLTA